ncbi:hypothetical protein LIOPPNJA_27280 [Robbsia andropogonis]|nr:hypothetical protein [Robbsia andropogonis]MCP1121622.1 hypothetical protein [Robbsia andropogonis]MCP1131437.1 hypothetical protein [Robbsia andropogonis]
MEVSAENLIVEVGNQQKIKPSTMSKDTKMQSSVYRESGLVWTNLFVTGRGR